MKKRTAMVMLMAGAMAFGGLVTPKGRGATVADDPYGPLRLYDGKWNIKTSDAEKNEIQVENHCTKTGLFFACEQVVKGKSEALVLFLPIAKTATGGQEYRTQALDAGASPAGEWGKLTIEGDRWVYSWESKDGEKKLYWRNINTFTRTDKIHFEVQRSEDGSTVSVRFWPSCVEGMQLLGALRFCRRVNLVGKNVVGVSPGDGEIEAGQQLCQRFTFSAFQHRQGVSPLVSHSDTFREWRNDSDADSTLFDCLFDVRQVWEISMPPSSQKRSNASHRPSA